MLPWIYLIVAGLLEIGWAVGLKYTAGWSRPGPSLVTLLLMAASLYLLSLATRDLPIGMAYAVWTGMGAIGTVIVGIVVFDEPRTPLRLLCLLMIFAGIAGLKMAHPPS